MRVAIIVVLACAGGVHAWSTYDFPWSESDLADDGLAPGGDLRTISGTLENGSLVWHHSLGETTGASGQISYFVGWNVNGSLYSVEATITWVAGSVSSIATGGPGYGTVVPSVAEWHEETNAIVWTVGPEFNATPGALLDSIFTRAGATIGGLDGCLDCFDAFDAVTNFTLSRKATIQYVDVDDAEFSFGMLHETPRSGVWSINWSAPAFAAVEYDGGAFIDEGAASYSVTDPAGVILLAGDLLEFPSGTLNGPFAAGTWIINMTATQVSGIFGMDIYEVEQEDSGSPGTGSPDVEPTEPEPEDEPPEPPREPTQEPVPEPEPTADAPEKESPGPAVGLLLGVGLAIAWRRQR